MPGGYTYNGLNIEMNVLCVHFGTKVVTTVRIHIVCELLRTGNKLSYCPCTVYTCVKVEVYFEGGGEGAAAERSKSAYKSSLQKCCLA